MNWKDIAGVVGKAAPLLGTLVGGPAGGAVGALIAAGLGVDSNADAVNNALTSNPDLYVKLQEIEANNRVQLQQLAVTAEQNRLSAANAQYVAEASDRDSARKLAAQQPTDHTRQYLTYLITILIAGVVAMIFSGAPTVKELLKDPSIALTVGTVLGYLFNEWKQVLGFWFGATKDQSQTAQTIANFAVTPGSVTTPDAPVTVPAAGSTTASPLDRVQP